MNETEAIINPARGKNSPSLGPMAVMVSSGDDLQFLCDLMNLGKKDSKNLMMSRVYGDKNTPPFFSISGPMIGAPYAVILLETLIARGAKKILFFGSCGAVSQNIDIGDIILPTSSLVDEGTSLHYPAEKSETAMVKESLNSKDLTAKGDLYAFPSESMVEKTKLALLEKDLSFHEGAVWSTDAIFRETRTKVADYQQKNILAVEMEVSALFSVGAFRNVDVCAVLAVSDAR